ncbi:MAG: T9SS type A sorting domain-containing protein [Saprospiraceae bacterium]|nr:T9SS type A sorting domain-containing protein [Saprospiraceae bacterium]
MFRSFILPFAALLLLVTSIEAQICQPDSMYLDSSGFVFPVPYDSLLNPEGGIDQEACINYEFDFAWTLKVPDTIMFPGIPIPIPVESFTIDTVGAISNLPIGINYKCNPPNGKFLAGKMGCVQLYGKPTSANPVGIYDLEFVGVLKTKTGANIPVTFPNPQLFPGHYYLKLNEENSPNCTTATSDPDAWLHSARVIPNPVTDLSILEVNGPTPQSIVIRMFDMTGRTFRTWVVQIDAGIQHIPLDLYDLPAGYWIYQLHSDRGFTTSGSLIKTSR